MKILITGGLGYIGFALMERLIRIEDVEQVIIYDNLSRNHDHVFFGKLDHHEKVKLIRADILDSRKLKKAIQNIDLVFHLAAKVTTPFSNQDPHFFEQINHWGTAELVYAIEDSDVKKMIYISSTSVFDQNSEEVNELSIPNPHTYYGMSKWRGEQHVQRLIPKIETLIVRCGNVYGYHKAMRFDAVINNFMMQAQFENKISINGSGVQTRAFIHIDELAHILTQIAEIQIPSGIYNCISKTLAINDIASVILELYPGCERIFTNQHLQLGSIKVSKDSKLWQFIEKSETDLLDELSIFKEKFAFSY